MIDKEGYRENVAIVIINSDHKVLWAKRTNENAWQFPQGGIKKNETIEGAMFRELKEEVGIDEDKIEILGRISDWLYYDVPKNWIRKDNNLYKGQKQIWFLLKLIVNDKNINLLNKLGKTEFDDWKWQEFVLPASKVVDFKKNVYRKALLELAPYIFSKEKLESVRVKLSL